MEYVTTTSGAKKIALHGINHWLDWYYYSQPMSISNRKICEERNAKNGATWNWQWRQENFPYKNLGDLSPLQGHLQESLNLDLEDFMSQNSEVDPLALHHFLRENLFKSKKK